MAGGEEWLTITESKLEGMGETTALFQLILLITIILVQVCHTAMLLEIYNKQR